MSKFTKAGLADIAEKEGKKHLVWSPGSEADKFKKKFWPVFGKGKWSWCAATVTYCCEQAGLVMPVNCPSKFGYTFAMVEAWQQWAMEKGFYHDNSSKFKAERGDITCFDWDQASIDDEDQDWENHIGVLLEKKGSIYIVAEGNTSNMTNVKERMPKQIQGFIRIPDGYEFPTLVEETPTLPKPKSPLHLGDQGEAVKGLQSALLKFAESFSPGTIDGVYGQMTKLAVTNFQKFNKITPITGVADEAVLELL